LKSLALAALLICSSAFSAEVFCTKGYVNSSFTLNISKQGVVASTQGTECPMSYVGYGLDWVRVAPDTECAEFAAITVGRKGISGEPLNIHWLSLSSEVMKGMEGPAQLGFENDVDPEAGGTLKANMRCFPR
jgi:hypothetical protein